MSDKPTTSETGDTVGDSETDSAATSRRRFLGAAAAVGAAAGIGGTASAAEGETAASATFDDQTTGGASVTVASAAMPEGGFVAIHDSSLLDGKVFESVIGVSEKLDAGTHEDVDVELFTGVPGGDFDQSTLEGEQTLIAMPHLDTNGNGTYDFLTSEGSEDDPYSADGETVVDDAAVTVEDDGDEACESAGLVTVKRDGDIEDVVDELTATIEGMDALTLMTTVDHAANASSVGKELPPTTLLVFGNPNVGTELMQAGRTAGIDLPQKLLVWEEDGRTFVGYNDPEYLADRHCIEGQDDRLGTVGNLLRSLATGEAGGTAEPSSASARFEDQCVDGASVVVSSATVPEGGFVAIHDSSLLDGETFSSVVGVSDTLDAGTHEDVEVDLFSGVPGNAFDQSMLKKDRTLIAMPHRDTNDNDTYDFVTSEGDEDGPYTGDGQPVTDDAEIRVAGVE